MVFATLRIPSMELPAAWYLNCLSNVKSMSVYTLLGKTLHGILQHILINFEISKLQGPMPNISQMHSAFLEKRLILCFPIFSIGRHVGFSTRLNFAIQKPCSLMMLHVKSDNIRCSGSKE